MTGPRWLDPVAAIQQAFYAVLSGDEDLATLLDRRIYDHVPEGAAYPYMTVGEAVAQPDNTLNSFGAVTTATVHVWSDYRGFVEPNRIAGQAVSLLDHQPLPVAGHRVVAVRWQQTQPVKDPDPRVRHVIVRLQVVTEQEM